MGPDIVSRADGRDLPPADLSERAPDRPLVPLAAALCLGIAVESAFQLRPLLWTLLVPVTLLVAGGVWWLGARRLLLPALTLTFACLGG
jgi:hypothetical protein